MTYRSAVKRAKKLAKDHAGESYYVVEGYEVLTECELVFECEQSPRYGDRVASCVIWWPENNAEDIETEPAHYFIEEYGFVEYQAA